MADTDSPLQIVVQFDTTQPEQALNRLEERAKKGITVVTRSSEGAPGQPSTAQTAAQAATPRTAPAPAQLQAEMDAAAARGDYARVRQLAEQAQRGDDPRARRNAERVDRSWDQAAFAQFKQEERAEQRLARAKEREAAAAERAAEAAERRAQRVSRAQQDTSLSVMGPNAQRAALRDLAEREPDPIRRAALERRATALNRRAGWNTELFGTGQYMNFLFGGFEVAQSVNAANAAQRFATVNPGDLQGQMKAWNTALDRMSSGILGSVIGMFSQGARQRIADVEGGANAGDARATAMAAFASASRSRGEAAFIASGGSDIERRRRENQIARINATKDVTKEIDALTVMSQGDQARRIAEIDSEHSRMLGDIARSAAASETFADPADIQKAAAWRAQQLAAVTAQSSQGVTKRRQQLQQELAKLNVPFDLQDQIINTEDRRMLTDSRLSGRASILRAQGLDREAALTDILRAFQTDQITSERALDETRAVMTATERESAARSFAQGEQRRAEERDRARRTRSLGADAQATALMMARDPLGAQLAMIERDRRAGLPDIGTTPSRSQIQEMDAYEQASTMRRAQARQERADMLYDVSENQETRRRQLVALRRRDPMGARVEGIVGDANAEATRLQRIGDFEGAGRARQLGVQQLDLLKQEYRDAFQGVAVSKDMAQALAFGLIKNAGENPANVLRGIEQGKDQLEAPQWAKDFVAAIDKAADKIGAFITN